jgi:uncharacterized membrane protein AbrB (regulator of aidB expression)
MSQFTLRRTSQPIQWAALLAGSVVCVAAFELMRLPAALMLGAIGAAICLCWFEGRVTIPPWGFVIAEVSLAVWSPARSPRTSSSRFFTDSRCSLS